MVKKSWNMKNWPKVMEYCDQSWNYTKFVFFLVTAKKLSRNLESQHSDFFRKMSRIQIQGLLFCQVCGNPNHDTGVRVIPLIVQCRCQSHGRGGGGVISVLGLLQLSPISLCLFIDPQAGHTHREIPDLHVGSYHYPTMSLWYRAGLVKSYQWKKL